MSLLGLLDDALIDAHSRIARRADVGADRLSDHTHGMTAVALGSLGITYNTVLPILLGGVLLLQSDEGPVAQQKTQTLERYAHRGRHRVTKGLRSAFALTGLGYVGVGAGTIAGGLAAGDLDVVKQGVGDLAFGTSISMYASTQYFYQAAINEELRERTEAKSRGAPYTKGL